jgi:hypothetical protein
MTTNNIAYATTGTITITQPASSATAGQGSTAVVNTGSLYVDALVSAVVAGGTIAAANDKTEYIFSFAGLASASNINISTQEMANPGTNAAIGTIDVPTNLFGPLAMEVTQTGTVSKTFTSLFSMAQFTGGVLPPYWGVAVRNYFGATGTLAVTFTGITYTNA